MKINMSHPKEFYIKLIVIFFVILMITLILINLHKKTNPNQITEKQKNELFNMFEKNTNAKISKFATYGKHFNIEGTIDIVKLSGIKINYVDLILKNLNGDETNIKTNFSFSDNICSFSTFNEINAGINLEELSEDTYYFLLKVTSSNGDIKYYSLENNSNYNNITYYTITKNNSNNKIDISFNEYNHTKCLNIHVAKTPSLPDDVYDIAIDPARGGLDSGSTLGEYTEANIVLQYSLKLKSELEKLGLKVYISRNENSPANEDTLNNMYSENGRINLLNATHSKLLLSLGLNGVSYDQKNGGIEIYAPSNCNLNFATLLAQNIANSSDSNLSQNTAFKQSDGVYIRNFTSNDILSFKTKAEKSGYEPYNITLSTPYLYIIRETGGISTNAFVDGRNKSYGSNKYFNENFGIESYAIDLGYMSIENDLNNILNNSQGYISGIIESVKSYCNL